MRALYDALRGRMVTISDVVAAAERGSIRGLRLSCYRAWRKQYEIENILIVLCVLGLATAEKQGRGFVFWIPSKETFA